MVDAAHGSSDPTLEPNSVAGAAVVGSKWFYNSSTGIATGATHCGLLLKGLRPLVFTAMDEQGGHEDLYGSGHQSAILYVHGRCCIVVCVCGVVLG
jgi:hypothetical protein